MIDLLIPCYNEDKNIKKLINEWKTIVSDNKKIFVHFIDNGSTDNTSKILRNEISTYNSENINLISIPQNFGYGYGIKEGIKQTNNNYISWTHADLQISSKDVSTVIFKYLSLQNKKEFLFMGKRKDRRPFDKLFTLLMTFLTLIFTRHYLVDINAQPKIFPRSIIKNIESFPDDFNIDLALLILAKKNKLKIKYNPLIFQKRNFNEAKGGGSLNGKIKLSIATVKFLVTNFLKSFKFWNR